MTAPTRRRYDVPEFLPPSRAERDRQPAEPKRSNLTADAVEDAVEKARALRARRRASRLRRDG